MMAKRRQYRGQMAHCAGEAAEQRIAQDYERRGYAIARQRWRGQAGEIDLITRNADGLVFIEVKQSRDFATAAERLSHRQMQRISASAGEYLAGEPEGQLTNVRFDVALVDGQGRFEILENAFFAH